MARGVDRAAGLRAIAPLISTDGYGEGWSFRSGVLEAGFLGTWIAGSLAPDDLLWLDDLERSFADRDGLAALAPWIRDWYAEPVDAEYWSSRSVTRERESIRLPILHVAGWYDCFLAGTLRSSGPHGEPPTVSSSAPGPTTPRTRTSSANGTSASPAQATSSGSASGCWTSTTLLWRASSRRRRRSSPTCSARAAGRATTPGRRRQPCP